MSCFHRLEALAVGLIFTKFHGLEARRIGRSLLGVAHMSDPKGAVQDGGSPFI